MRPGVGVGVFVVRDGKFLIGQRKGSHGAGSWSVPGGWLEYRESFEDGARRELAEETGLVVSDARFVGLTNNIFQGEEVHSITVWMMAKWQGGEAAILEADKFVDQRWVDFDSLPQPLFLAFELLLKSDFLPAVKQEIAKL